MRNGIPKGLGDSFVSQYQVAVLDLNRADDQWAASAQAIKLRSARQRNDDGGGRFINGGTHFVCVWTGDVCRGLQSRSAVTRRRPVENAVDPVQMSGDARGVKRTWPGLVWRKIGLQHPSLCVHLIQ